MNLASSRHCIDNCSSYVSTKLKKSHIAGSNGAFNPLNHILLLETVNALPAALATETVRSIRQFFKCQKNKMHELSITVKSR